MTVTRNIRPRLETRKIPKELLDALLQETRSEEQQRIDEWGADERGDEQRTK